METTVDQELRDAGLRVTAGRRHVLASLEANPHSDAESIHRHMRSNNTSSSVQSVHNVLNDLAAAGIIRRIEPAGSPARYERRVADNHHHAVCTQCGAISDVDCVVGHAPCLTPSDTAGFVLQSAEVVFWGLCAECAAAPTR
jgi:Fur family ferric uptake transcriptional regulator